MTLRGAVFGALIVAVAALGAPTRVPASMPSATYRVSQPPFGAIAIEPRTWIFGVTLDAKTIGDARAGAKLACNASTGGRDDCIIAAEFYDLTPCGSVVHGVDSQEWMAGSARTADAAAADAAMRLVGISAASHAGSAVVITTQCNAAIPSPATPAPAGSTSISIGAGSGGVSDPIEGISSRTNVHRDGTYEQCLSFRNVTDKEVVALKYQFRLLNEHYVERDSFDGTFERKLTPGAAANDTCWRGRLPSPAQITDVTMLRDDLVSVRFSDGTTWTPQDPWTKAFTVEGSPLPAPQRIFAAYPFPKIAYGAIAMQPATHAFGTGSNARSPEASAAAAISSCNQQSGGASGCAIIVSFFGVGLCGAAVIDGSVIGAGAGYGSWSALANALADLRAKGGKIGENHTIAACNAY
jgi:hypothetical protein